MHLLWGQAKVQGMTVQIEDRMDFHGKAAAAATAESVVRRLARVVSFRPPMQQRAARIIGSTTHQTSPLISLSSTNAGCRRAKIRSSVPSAFHRLNQCQRIGTVRISWEDRAMAHRPQTTTRSPCLTRWQKLVLNALPLLVGQSMTCRPWLFVSQDEQVWQRSKTGKYQIPDKAKYHFMELADLASEFLKSGDVIHLSRGQ